jgi:hypothetical protein
MIKTTIPPIRWAKCVKTNTYKNEVVTVLSEPVK